MSTMDHPHIQNVVHDKGVVRQRREASVHVVEIRQESNAQGGSWIPESESAQQSCMKLEQRVLNVQRIQEWHESDKQHAQRFKC